MLQLIYTLTGDDAHPPILDGHLNAFLCKLTGVLEDAVWLGQLRGRSGAIGLFEAYGALTLEAKAAVLLLPEGFSAINALSHSASEENFASLIRLCASLQGDGAQHVLSSSSSDEDIFVVGDTLSLDLGSDFCRRCDPNSPIFFGEFQPHTAQEADTVKRKLAEALAEIGAVSPTFAKLIRNNTRTTFVRKHAGLVPASEQVDTEVGGIRLRNVHLDEYTHEQLMDDLIHESVHNYLATFEFIHYPFLVHGGSNEPNARPVSPWSMRPIRALPFVHAAFVYFAILNFSRRRLRNGLASETSREDAVRRRNRYASGFLMPGSLSAKISEAADVDPRALQMLDWMQRIVTDMFKASETDTAIAPCPEITTTTQYVHAT